MVVACLLHGWQSSGRRVATGSRCWPRSEPAAGAGCVALPDRRFVTYSLCAIPAIFTGQGLARPVRHRPDPGRAARVSFHSCHYPGWAMLTTPSPLGVSGRAARVSIHSCHYPGWAMLTTPSPLGVSGRAVRVSLSVRVSVGSGRASPAIQVGECARQGQWPGPVLAGAAVAASQCRGRASESAVTGHEWPHADGAPVGTVLEPFIRSAESAQTDK